MSVSVSSFQTELELKYLKFLTTALNSTDTTVKVEALRKLSEVGNKTDKALLQKLRELLKDDSISVRIEAAKTISKFGRDFGIRVLLGIIKDQPKFLPTDTAPKRAMKFAKNLNRVRAIEALGEIGIVNDAIRTLLKDIKNSKEEEGIVKDAAIISLIKLGERDLAKSFIFALSSTDPNIRAKACEVLGEIKEDRAKARIGKLLKHFNKNVRVAACLALAKLNAVEYSDRIKALLNDKEETVRIAACESLGMLGQVAIKEITESKSSGESLPGVEETKRKPVDISQLIADLKKLLDDNNGFVRLAACRALMQLGDNSGRNFVISSLKAEDTDAVVKTIEILANFGKKAEISALEDAFNKHQSELVKLNIASAIVGILNRERR